MSSSPSPPLRSQRQACWDSRDNFFSCLNKNDILDANGEKATNICGKFRKLYEKNCSKSWVDYFNKRRILEARQKLILEKMATENKS